VGKEESNSSSHGKETQEQNIEEMNNFIRNLSNKLVKLEFENRNPLQYSQPSPKQNFSPKY